MRERNAFFRRLFRPGDLVFDIGANDGEFAEMLLKLGSRVVSVEPQPICAQKLQELAAVEPRLTVVPCALGAKAGTAEMFIAGDGSQNSSLSKDWIDQVKLTGRFAGHDWNKSITVPIRRLDDIIDDHGVPAFCKIDVEGFEAEVVAGLSTAIPAISIEYTPEHRGSLLACVGKLSSLGEYRFNLAPHGVWEMYWPRWLSADGICAALDRPSDPILLKGGDVYARLVG